MKKIISQTFELRQVLLFLFGGKETVAKDNEWLSRKGIQFVHYSVEGVHIPITEIKI